MRRRKTGLGFALVLMMAVPSCIELPALLAPGTTLAGTDNPDAIPGGGGSEPEPAAIPAATLSVSNPVPRVGEEVVLTCVQTAGDTAGVRFDFQPEAPRLSVDTVAGRATFIVDPLDVGSEFRYTCTATNPAGTSPPSNLEIVIPVE